MAKVSVIIPTHNRARVLRNAVQSAKNAGTDVEVIVVDDASTDETASMCRELTGITFIRLDRNVGQAAARNAGILRSSGEYVAFLDDDDLRIAGSIDKQAELLMRDDRLGFVYGYVHIGDPVLCKPTGEIRPPQCPAGDIFWSLLEKNFIYIASTLVRRQCLENVGLFDEAIRGTEDWDMWIRLAELFPVGALEEPVAIYRESTRDSGQTSSNLPRMWKSTACTLAKALECKRAQEVESGKREELKTRLMDALWDKFIAEGRDALSKHQFRYAADCYATAIQLHPRRALRPAALINFIRGLMPQ